MPEGKSSEDETKFKNNPQRKLETNEKIDVLSEKISSPFCNGQRIVKAAHKARIY